jgi:hypothetical protein
MDPVARTSQMRRRFGNIDALQFTVHGRLAVLPPSHRRTRLKFIPRDVACGLMARNPDLF